MEAVWRHCEGTVKALLHSASVAIYNCKSGSGLERDRPEQKNITIVLENIAL